MSKLQSSRERIQNASRLIVESLENRCMLSGTHVSLSHGSLDVIGTGKADHISVAHDHRHKNLVDVNFNGKSFTFRKAKVQDISVSGKAGNDVITVDPALTAPTTLLGGAGNDTIKGDGGNDDIEGGDGNDSIAAGNGDDQCDGGAGNDSITAGNGNDQIDGGTGSDQCEFHHNSGIAFTDAPSSVQAGLTTLAQGTTITNVQVFNEDGQTYYGTIVSISGVNTRIVVDADGNPVSFKSHDNGNGGGDHHGDQRTFGSIVSVDVNAATITINLMSEHGAPQQKTFNVDPGADITIDGNDASLGDLGTGAWVSVDVSPTDATTVIAIKAFGKSVEGVVGSVDSVGSTITISSEHNQSPQTFDVDHSADITLDGQDSTLDALTAGTHVHLKFSTDNQSVVSIEAESQDNHGGGGDHGGPDF